ncbi:MAG: hypothetical protein ACRDF4_07575, partial [Rhabdochlamydiaceae bacterium]
MQPIGVRLMEAKEEKMQLHYASNLGSEKVGKIGEAYGGVLVDKVLPAEKSEKMVHEAGEMPKVRPFTDFIYDAEKIAIGAYSPLEGFMDSSTFDSVARENRLPNRLPWTIPIILAIREDEVKSQQIKEGLQLALLDWKDKPFAILDVAEVFRYSKEDFAKGAYSTTDTSHPNVNDIYNNYGNIALAGEVTLIRKLELPTVKYELSPKETRELFKNKGWKNVVAYQCRNPPHTAHEYIQKVSLENSDIDGLLIHPVIGRLKKGDY